MNSNSDQLKLMTVKQLRDVIKQNNLSKNWQSLRKDKLIEIIQENQKFNNSIESSDNSEEDNSEEDNKEDNEEIKRYTKAINLLIDEDEDEDDLNNFDIVEGKKPKRKILNKKLSKKLLKIPENKYELKDCKNDVKKLLDSHKQSINNLYNKYRRSILDDEDIEDIINEYNILRTDVENELNMCIDDLQDEPNNSFYTWIENSLDLHKNKIEKLIN